MPADPSSSIPSALTQLTHAAPLQDAEAGHLLAYLGTVPDPRAGRGRRHPLVAILAMAAAAVLTGARSVAAVAEWASDTPQPVRAALGARREGPDRRRRAVAVDGKTLRGSGGDGHQMHLLAAMEHTSRRVLAQREVDGAPGEVPGFVPLLEPVDLAGAVVTADALHTHREHADWLVADKQADYLFTQGPRPAHRTPPQDPDRLRGHQPGPCAGQPRPAGRPHPRPLGDRERTAPRARRHLRRRRLPAPQRGRAADHGSLAQPSHRRAQPRWAGQPRRRATPPQLRSLPTPGHPRNQPRICRTRQGPRPTTTRSSGS